MYKVHWRLLQEWHVRYKMIYDQVQCIEHMDSMNFIEFRDLQWKWGLLINPV